jgi:hypothetical protein
LSIRRTRRTTALAAQAIDLGLAVPQVVAHRLAQMALAGASPSARDRKEFHRMGAEKIVAFSQSWNAMTMHAILASQQLAFSFMQSFWFPWSRPRSFAGSASTLLQGATLAMLGKGMAPIRRHAVANAKRLGRATRR